MAESRGKPKGKPKGKPRVKAAGKPKARPQSKAKASPEARVESKPAGGQPGIALHNLRPALGATHRRKRIGRGPGSGHGKTAGRGSKGFWSRSGSSQKRGFEGGQMPLHRRVPKRGFTNIFRKEFSEVNVDVLSSRFQAGATVGPDELKSARVVRKLCDGLKVLGRGEISIALTVRAHRFSAEARRKIEAAGGKVEIL